MKALFKLIILLLLSNISYSQYYSNVTTPIKWTKGGFDSLFIPARDTITPSDKSKAWIVYRAPVLYVWTANKWTAISAGGGTGGTTYVLPQADSNTLGGIRYNTDLALDANDRLGIAPGKKDLWNSIVRLQLYYATGDSTRKMISDSIAAHPPYKFNAADFYIQDSTVYAINKVSGEGDPIYSASPASQLTYDHLTLIAQINDTSLHPLTQSVRDWIAAARVRDSTYFDRNDFTGFGSAAYPIKIIRYSNAQVDSLLATKGSGSGSYHYNGDSTFYLGGDTTLHRLPVTLSPNDSIDYSFSAMTSIYSEAGPGEANISSSNVTANKDNLNFPFRQLKSLDVGGWSDGSYVSFTYPVAKNSTAYTFLRGFINLKQVVPIGQSISFQFYNNGSPVSQRLSAVNYGLDKSKINSYQNVTIPMNAFGFTSNTFNEVRLIFGGGSSSPGLYLDVFQFQNATAQENTYLTDIHKDASGNVYKTLGGQDVFAFKDSVGSSSGGITGGSIAWPGTIYSTPTTGVVSSGNITYSPTLTNQSAYTIFGRGSGSGTPSFLSSLDSNWIPTLHSQGYYDKRYAAIGSGSSSGWALSGNSINPATDFIGTTSNNSLRFRTNAVERMVIDSSGNIGIGTISSSAYKVDISGGIRSSTLVSAGTALQLGGGNVISNSGSTLMFGNSASYSNTAFYAQGSEGMYISGASGNVAIGAAGRNTSKLYVAGSLGLITSTKTGNYALTVTDFTVFANATSAPITITLPDVSTGILGRVYVIKKIDATANAVTIATSASQTIDGVSTYTLNGQWKYVTVQTNGSNWFVIGNN